MKALLDRWNEQGRILFQEVKSLDAALHGVGYTTVVRGAWSKLGQPDLASYEITIRDGHTSTPLVMLSATLDATGHVQLEIRRYELLVHATVARLEDITAETWRSWLAETMDATT